MPPYARRQEQIIPASTWALVSLIVPLVLLGISFFLVVRCGLCRKILKRGRRTREDQLISTTHSDGGETQVDSDDRIVDVHEVTKEGLALSAGVIPPSAPSYAPRESTEPREDGNDTESSACAGGVDTRSIAYSATIRRQYLERELRRTQEQIVDIDNLTTRGSPTTSRMSLATMLGSPIGESNEDMAELLKAARDRNAMLQARIEGLETQMQSAWALGLSDEAPPDYTLTA
ncbi:hypothetical protein B0H11DRAFT_2295196 [Mycena galericulata]|nr:hypothetical protein B0H11DRAFT_2295196 [Mycena galericulata]